MIESVVLILLCWYVGLEHRQPINSFFRVAFLFDYPQIIYLAESSTLLPFWAVLGLCEWQMCAVSEPVFAFRKSQNTKLAYLQKIKAR